MTASQDEFDSWVSETRHALARYLVRYLVSNDDIQDVLQEAYLKVYCVLRSRQGVEHAPTALLYTTARNLAISRLRHSQVVARSIPAATVAEELRREHRSAEQQFDRSEQRRRLLMAVNQLPPKCREVFVLRIIDGLSQREIGARLGITTSTVEKHLAKGMRLCKVSLAARAEGKTVVAADPPRREQAS